MRTAIISRLDSSDEGTFGSFLSDWGFKCVTGELPWRENEPNWSCIPEGIYLVEWGLSPKFGNCYHVKNVPGRDNIEIHAANLMGDSRLGFRSSLLGCIAPGQNMGTLHGQKAVMRSRPALAELELEFDREPFQLTIQNF